MPLADFPLGSNPPALIFHGKQADMVHSRVAFFLAKIIKVIIERCCVQNYVLRLVTPVSMYLYSFSLRIKTQWTPLYQRPIIHFSETHTFATEPKCPFRTHMPPPPKPPPNPPPPNPPPIMSPINNPPIRPPAKGKPYPPPYPYPPGLEYG